MYRKFLEEGMHPLKLLHLTFESQCRSGRYHPSFLLNMGADQELSLGSIVPSSNILTSSSSTNWRLNIGILLGGIFIDV